jgi:[CysO sulfur-carrier protein]-S-L-cysteine hydrolase
MLEFRIPEQVARALIEHAQAEYPKECCGLLAGSSGESREIFKLTNVDPDPVMRYNADSRELKHAMDEIDDRDWELAAIYHSHTHTPAYPSPTDVERAAYPTTYVLVSLQDRAKPDLRAFRIVEGRIEEVPVVSEEIAMREGE